MSGILTKDTLFASSRSRAENKADTTTSVARAILNAEVAQREAKTARLREARQAMEAQTVAEAPAKKPRKAAKPRKR